MYVSDEKAEPQGSAFYWTWLIGVPVLFSLVSFQLA